MLVCMIDFGVSWDGCGVRGGDCGGEHGLDRAAEPRGSGRDVVVLRRDVGHLTVEQRHFHRDVDTVDGHRAHLADQRPLGHPVLAQADRRALGEDHAAYGVGVLGFGEHRQRVRGPALLHQDRREPRVGRAGGEQCGEHGGPESRVEVVDVGLEHQGLRSSMPGRRGRCPS